MPVHRQFFWATGAAAAMFLSAVSVVMAAQDPFQVTEKGADKSADKTAVKKVAPEPEFVRKSLQEWQRILPRGVFEVTRLKATEAAFTGRYASGHFNGTFICACCNAELFASEAKFESGTGWPSFWRPIKLQAIDRAIDNSDDEPRIEVMCHRCDAHLGHVFDDGPPPTGLRFCINSLSLKLKRPEGDTAKPSATKAKSKSKVKTTRTKSRSTSGTSRVKAKPKTTETDAQEPSAEKPAAARAADKRKADET